MEAMVERIGPGQLMYGTDMPFQNRFCTYQSVPALARTSLRVIDRSDGTTTSRSSWEAPPPACSE